MGKKIFVKLEDGYQVVKESKLKHEKIPSPKKPQPGIGWFILWTYLGLIAALALANSFPSRSGLFPSVDIHPDPTQPLPSCPDPQLPFC